MTGPSIVVPPAMPQRSFPPRVPHSTSSTGRSSHQGAKSVKGSGLNANANANTTKTTPAPGRKERVATRRVCSTSSCTNVLERGWPWKRCRQCKTKEVRKSANPRVCVVDVSCMACFAASAVPVNELKAGQLYLCTPCRERNAALATALMQPPTLNPSHPLASPRTIIMHNASPKRDANSFGHGPPPVSHLPSPNQSMFVPTPPPPPQGQFVPIPIVSDTSISTASGSSPFDAIMRFVHPDHRHILGQRGVLVPPPPSQIASAPAPAPASQHTVAPAPPATPPAVKRVRLNTPHYSRTGAILAVLPEDLGMKRASLPRAKASEPPPTPARTAETENMPGSSSASLTQNETRPLETPRKVSVTQAQDGSIKLTIPPRQTPPPVAPAPIPSSSDKSPLGPGANAVASSSSLAPAPQRKKRKRPQKAAIRICESPGCENVIPPRFKGARCVQCGFARWSTAFRERFDGIRAELIHAGIAGPAEAVKEKEMEGPGREAETPNSFVEQQLAPEDTPSSATIPGSEQARSAAQDGVSPRTSSVLHAGIPRPSVFRKPSVKSVKLIVSPRHTEPADSANSPDPRPSSFHTEILPSPAADISRPRIKSIKLRVSAPPDLHTPSIDIPATHPDDTPQITPAIPADMNAVEAERIYPMDIDHDREASDGDMTDTEASIPLAYRYAATDTKNLPQHSVPDAAEAEAEYPYPTYFDHDLEDHTRDATESEASVPLADWPPSLIPSTTPRSSSSMSPVRRIRLILGPNPVRAPSSSRESSPDLALSSSRPFSVRRRWEELGWDTDESDLTPLEDSTDEGESEIDLPEGGDEEGEEDGGAGTGTRLSIVIPRRTEKPPEKHRWQCATAQCANVLAYGSFFKKCDACRKRIHLRRKQEATRDRLEDAAPSKYADSEFHIPPDADLTGYRECGHARCNHLIPPASQYRYRTCGPCRALRRRRWWKQRGLEPPPEDAPVRRQKTSASIMERAIANAVRTAAKEEGLAAGKRKRQAADDAWEEVPSSEKLMEMPPYQHFAALLDALRARFSQFKAVQTRYVQLKALTGADSKPMVFNFDGEYSVVTDPSGGSVDAVVNTVIHNVQAALDLRFQPAGVNLGPEDSVIASLRGAYVAQIPRLSGKPVTVANTTDHSAFSLTDPAADAPVEVTMAGELHVCVAWDRRHKFFPGKRVMLRFRLVG